MLINFVDATIDDNHYTKPPPSSSNSVNCLSYRKFITSKLCLLVHKVFVSYASDYLANLVMPASDITSRSVVICAVVQRL